MPAKPLGSVIRHMTTPPTPSSLSQFAPPKTCLLQPKKALQDGRVPGMFHNLFVTNRQPPSIDQEDQSESEVGKKCLVAPGGVNFRVTDIAPKTKGNLHKTPSLDFLVVHRGTVTLHLDSGEKRVVSEGEAIVQRGTVHAWENESDEWVRMFVVLLEATEAAQTAEGTAGV